MLVCLFASLSKYELIISDADDDVWGKAIREAFIFLPWVECRKAVSLIRNWEATQKRMEALHWQSAPTDKPASQAGNRWPGDHFKRKGTHACKYRGNLERHYSAYKNLMSQQMVAFLDTCLKEGITFKARKLILFPLRSFHSTGKDMSHKLISWICFKQNIDTIVKCSSWSCE